MRAGGGAGAVREGGFIDWSRSLKVSCANEEERSCLIGG